MSNFAIAHLSYFPVRKEADHRSENITQLLFGEVYQVLETKENWHFIKVLSDDYEGWIDCSEIKAIDEKTYFEIKKQRTVYAAGFFQKVGNDTNQHTIGFGSPLPYWDGISFQIADEEFFLRGEVIQANPTYTNEFLLERAKRLLGIPYLWGGRSTFGIDCSGFVQSLFKLANIALPRDAYQQKEFGHVVDLNESIAGDLAFFANEEGRTSHVGVIMEDQKIIHASGKVRIDNLDEKGIFNSERAIYTHQLELIKRIK